MLLSRATSYLNRTHLIAAALIGLSYAATLPIAQAGNAQYVVEFTTLYAQASSSSKAIGVFRQHAQVLPQGAAEDGWQLVQTDAGLSGYIRTSSLSKSTKSSTNVASPFIEADDDYGSPHLVINAAALKARATPSNNKTACILRMGQPVAVDFVPHDIDAWVKLPQCGENGGYIQRKFLGGHPDIKTLFREFDNADANNHTLRKNLAERAVELAWTLDNKGNVLKPALKRYLQVAQAANDKAMEQTAQLGLKVADAVYPALSESAKTTARSKQRFGLALNKTAEDKLNLKAVNDALGAVVRKEKISNDGCGVYSGTHLYYYAGAKYEVNEKSKKGITLWSADFNKANFTYYFKGVAMDKTTTEENFLSYAKGWVTVTDNPHEYVIAGDGDGVVLTFRNGVLAHYRYFDTC